MLTAGTFVGISTAAVTLVTAAPAAAAQAPLNLANEQGRLWSCAFNPFIPSSLPYSFGLTYEIAGLRQRAAERQGDAVARVSSYAWSNANKTSDLHDPLGRQVDRRQALPAADVAYTFNLIKKNPRPRPQRGVVGALERDPVRRNKVI